MSHSQYLENQQTHKLFLRAKMHVNIKCPSKTQGLQQRYQTCFNCLVNRFCFAVSLKIQSNNTQTTNEIDHWHEVFSTLTVRSIDSFFHSEIPLRKDLVAVPAPQPAYEHRLFSLFEDEKSLKLFSP